MADIKLKCSHCGETTSVSEYIDPKMAACRFCGGKLNVPYKEVVTARPPPVKKKHETTDPKAAAGVFHTEGETMTVQRTVVERHRKRQKKRRRILVWTPNSGTLLGMFIAVTGILTFLRFGPCADDAAYKQFGMICLAVGHLALTVDAFNDNTMHGLLCLFVPFYSIFYLYWKCDSLLLRLGVGVFIMPFIYDITVFTSTHIMKLLRWLAGSEFVAEGF